MTLARQDLTEFVFNIFKFKRNELYSPLDRETIALIFSVNNFFMYLFGRKFKLGTDNSPLSRIFYQNLKLPAMNSARLLRYASYLYGFNFEASNHVNVDCLFRAAIVQQTYYTKFLTKKKPSTL